MIGTLSLNRGAVPWSSVSDEITSIVVKGAVKVTSCDSLFSYLPKLRSADLDGLDTSEAKTMFGMFIGCEALTDLEIANFNTDNLESARAMFSGCSSLKSLDLSGWNTANVTDMGIMFSNCSKLQRIFVGDSWTNANLTAEGKWATFSGCVSLAGVSDNGKRLAFDGVSSSTAYGDRACINAEDRPGYLTRAHDCKSVEVAKVPATCTEPGKTAGTACETCGLELSGFDEIPPLGHYFADGKCMRCGVLSYGDCGTDCVWAFNPETKTLVIKTADGKETGTLSWTEDYRRNAKRPWSAVASSIENIEIKGHVVPANCDSMFTNLESLKKADLSGLDTSAATKNISVANMFSNCGALEEVAAPYLVTSKVNDMNQLFHECIALKTVDVSNWDTQNVKSAWSIFWDCKYLDDLDVSKWNTGNMTNMAQMFHGCSSLTALDVSNWNTSSAENLDSIFRECLKLETLDVSKWDTNNVTDMGSVFGECSSLKALDVSNWDTRNVKTMGGMFRNCSALAELKFSGSFDTSSVGIGEKSDWLGVQKAGTGNVVVVDGIAPQIATFNEGDGSEVDVPQGVVERIKHAGFQCMFEGCSSLKELDISDWNTSNVNNMGSMFSGCASLEKLELPKGFNTSKVIDFRGMFMNCVNLSEIDAAKIDTQNARYITCVFAGCKNVTKLDVAEWDTTKVGAGDNKRWGGMSSLFADCSKLESLDLSKWDMNDVTDMADMFNGCDSLKDLKIAKVYADKIQEAGGSLGGMFAGCKSLETLDLSSWDASQKSDGDVGKDYATTSALSRALSLQLDACNDAATAALLTASDDDATDSVLVDYLNIERSKSLSGMFKGCINLKSIVLPDLQGFDSSDLSSMFAGCSNLESVDLSKLSTSGTLTMTDMFNGCAKLKELDLSNFNTVSVSEMTNMFKDCSGLKRIMVGSGWSTSSLANDEDELFSGCIALGGQNGTAYSDEHVTARYAHVDAEEDPGYLTVAHEHSYVDVPEKPATCTETGTTAGVKCNICALVQSGCEPIPALGHKFADGKCSVCNEPDPNAQAGGSGSGGSAGGSGGSTPAPAPGGSGGATPAPGDPGSSGGSGEPETPDTPDKPGEPDDPNTPGTGDEPSDPETPVYPEVGDTVISEISGSGVAFTVASVDAGDKTGELIISDYSSFAGSSVKIPASIQIDGITYRIIGIASNAFKGAKVTKVELPSSVKSIGKGAFSGCKWLKSLKAKGLKAFGADAFKGCKSLSSLTTGAELKSIGKGAFSGAKKLKTLCIASKKLSKKALRGCLKGSSVKTIEIKVSASKKLNKKYLKKYKKYFSKAHSGKEVSFK